MRFLVHVCCISVYLKFKCINFVLFCFVFLYFRLSCGPFADCPNGKIQAPFPWENQLRQSLAILNLQSNSRQFMFVSISEFKRRWGQSSSAFLPV